MPQTHGWSHEDLVKLQEDATRMLNALVPPLETPNSEVVQNDNGYLVSIGGFSVPHGSIAMAKTSFTIHAPTSLDNAMRILRACQLDKPILLEGSPGVGKTSLVAALATLTCNNLCRVNLSDQTDLMDLFGSDLPIEGGMPGEFAWKDAGFLRALQQGDWVLLDEMNLAPQSVLEGLNSILDHRGTIFVPELGRSFTKHRNFRIFAAQNPVHQGGGRKGLPKSFVNRFTKVYIEPLSAGDFLIICQHLYPSYSVDLLSRMIQFIIKLEAALKSDQGFGRQGGPWEFNLRDIMRWLALLHDRNGFEEMPGHPAEYLDAVFLRRFRTKEDRLKVETLFCEIFSDHVPSPLPPHPFLSSTFAQFGHALAQRSPTWGHRLPSTPMHQDLYALQTVTRCLQQGWLIILTGTQGSRKSSVVRHLAGVHGAGLYEFAATPSTDTTDLLGSFEQADQVLLTSIFADSLLQSLYSKISPFGPSDQIIALLQSGSSLTPELLQQVSGTIGISHTLQRLTTSPATGKFEWVDGPLIRAMKEGRWFLLDNANLCNPSVLDRLNSLAEIGGHIALTERGLVDGTVQLIDPHPNFRLIMAMDPNRGELSRAMRNRGIEVALSSCDQSLLESRLQSRCHNISVINHSELIDHQATFQVLERNRAVMAPPWFSVLCRNSSDLSLRNFQCLVRCQILNPTFDVNPNLLTQWRLGANLESSLCVPTPFLDYQVRPLLIDVIGS
jgi:midasin